MMLQRQVQAEHAVGGEVGAVAGLFQPVGQVSGQHGVVFDDQDVQRHTIQAQIGEACACGCEIDVKDPIPGPFIVSC